MRTDNSSADLRIKSYDHTFADCTSCDDQAGYALLAADDTSEVEVPICEYHAAKMTTMVEYDSK